MCYQILQWKKYINIKFQEITSNQLKKTNLFYIVYIYTIRIEKIDIIK